MMGLGANRWFVAAALAAAPPAFTPVTPHIDLAEPGRAPVAEFVGFDIVREGATKPSDVPEFVVGLASRVTAHWIPTAASPGPLEMVVSLKGSGPKVEIAAPVETTAWTPGVPQTSVLEISVPRFTHAGRGVLTLSLRGRDSDEPGAFVYRGPSYTHPIVTKSSFPEADIARLFGSDARSLRASFRLGEGARVPISCGPVPDRPCIGLGVVSALHHSFRFTDGEPVGLFILYDAGGGEIGRVELIAGADTSLSEYDVPRPGTFDLSQAAVASERPHPGGRFTWNKRPLTLYTYYATLPLDSPAEPARIEAQFVGAKGVLDVYDIVLLYGEAADDPGGE